MPRFESYSDDFTGRPDERIRALLDAPDDSGKRIQKILLKVINNELTARQKEIVVLYYYKNMTTVEIAAALGISQQAVSAVLVRARNRIFRVLQYYYYR